jgi:hypothetical protein
MEVDRECSDKALHLEEEEGMLRTHSMVDLPLMLEGSETPLMLMVDTVMKVLLIEFTSSSLTRGSLRSITLKLTRKRGSS